MQRNHVVDMRPAKAAGSSLFAANDPQARDAEFALLQSAPRVAGDRAAAARYARRRRLRGGPLKRHLFASRWFWSGAVVCAAIWATAVIGVVS